MYLLGPLVKYIYVSLVRVREKVDVHEVSHLLSPSQRIPTCKPQQKLETDNFIVLLLIRTHVEQDITPPLRSPL